MPSVHDLDVGGDPADPAESGRVELNALSAEHLILRDRLVQKPQRGAVLRRDTVEIIGSDDAGRPGHVRYDELRFAWNVPAEMPGKKSRVLVVAAAGGE